MSEQPEALRLAGIIAPAPDKDGWHEVPEVSELHKAAAELRRQHARIEADEALMRQALSKLDTLVIAMRAGMPEYGAEDQDELLDAAITALRSRLETK